MQRPSPRFRALLYISSRCFVRGDYRSGWMRRRAATAAACQAEVTTVREIDLELGNGRRLYAYDAGDTGAGLAVFWHHGTPNIGAPPEPLFEAAAGMGILGLV